MNKHYLSNPYLSSDDTDRIIALVREVNAKVMIEFGCQQGRTAKAILESVPSLVRYYGLDVPADFQTALANQQSEVPAVAGQFVRDDPRFVLITCKHGSLELTLSDLEPCDAVFIDGDHSARGVTHDSYLALDLMRSPGVIIWHDYLNPATEVTQVIDQLARSGWPIKFIAGTWLAYRLT